MISVRNTQYSHIRGFNYQPSYGATGYEIWHYFKPAVIQEEIEIAKMYFPGINTLRIWLSWDAYLRDSKSFRHNFDFFLSIGEKYKLKFIPVLFNAWQGFPYFGGIGLAHIGEMLSYPSYYEKYVVSYLKDIVMLHANDERILLWDICNKPAYLYFMDKTGKEKEMVIKWLTSVYNECKSLGAKQPISVGSMPSLLCVKDVADISDAITFHPYFPNKLFIQTKKQFLKMLEGIIMFANKKNKPVLATETGWGHLTDEGRIATLKVELEEITKRKLGFLCHLLHHTLIADGHKPEYGPVSTAGYMAFIDEDRSLRNGHEIFNDFCDEKSALKGKINCFLEHTKNILNKCKMKCEIDGEVYTLRVPSADMKYPAFWIRDSLYILESGLIEPEEILEWIKLIASKQNDKKVKHLKNGLIIPPFAIPDHINFDGTPVFFPGTYNSGNDQGSGNYGFYPPHDDQYFFIELAYRYFKLTKNTKFLKIEIQGIPLLKRMENAFFSYNIDQNTQLCFSSNGKYTVDWGFCDAIKKTGLLLFPSLLRYSAAIKMCEMLKAIEKQEDARKYLNIAHTIKRNIIKHFWDDSGYLLSSTNIGRQPDVAGTLFANFIGLLEGSKLQKSLNKLLEDYLNENTIDKDGYVRYVPIYADCSKESMWEKTNLPYGVYQNGGYWAFLVGWYIDSLRKIDQKVAYQYTQRFLNHIMSSRKSGAPFEWKNDKTAKNSGAWYAASATLPLAAISNIYLGAT